MFAFGGVTIGYGVDLGQMNKWDLKRLSERKGLDRELVRKIEPYLGAKKEDAQALLADRPLTLTKEEAEQLSRAKYNDIAQTLADRFNRDMAADGKSDITFFDLPDRMKTVALSVALQHGPALDRTAPRFWATLKNRDTKAMEAELRNFGPNYKNRRMLEADCLAGKN